VPRLPVDGKKVIEHRITLGGKERDLLESAMFSYRIQAITGDHPISELLSDPKTVILFIEAVATVIEIMGIDTPIPTPVDAYEFLQQINEKRKNNPGGWWDVDLRRDFERFFG